MLYGLALFYILSITFAFSIHQQLLSTYAVTNTVVIFFMVKPVCVQIF